MLVMDVGDQMCWWQVLDVGDNLRVWVALLGDKCELKWFKLYFNEKWFHYYEKIDSRFIIDQNRCIRYVVLWMIYVWNWCFIDFFIRSDFLRSKRSILKRQKTWWIKLQRRYCHIISQNWCLNLYFNLIRWSYTTNRC